jgi:hypothetical protein
MQGAENLAGNGEQQCGDAVILRDGTAIHATPEEDNECRGNNRIRSTLQLDEEVHPRSALKGWSGFLLS